MGNAFRLIIIFLALAAIGSTAALTQLGVRQRLQARHQLTADNKLPPDLVDYHRDQQQSVLIVTGVAMISVIAVALARGTYPQTSSAEDSNSREHQHRQEIEQLAKATATREEALQRERQQRRQADENLHIQQLLLNQALNEKIRLGRDLHDGVIQSLYATGLTLESARQKRAENPEAAEDLFRRGMQLLNDNIREIRAYIQSLSDSTPPRDSPHSFTDALHSIIGDLKTGREAEFTVRIDENAQTQLHPSQLPDILQIVRESVSNALRHGAATQINIRLHADGEHLALLIQDNGKGFDPQTILSEGHGLSNFKARAEILNAELKIDSKPNHGTRISLTFPATPPS